MNWCARRRPFTVLSIWWQWIALFSLMAVFIYGTPARATVGDTIQPYLGYSYFYDDNLFRVSDTNPAQKFSDTYRRAEGGLVFDKYFSRQHFTGSIDVNRTSFSRFSELDNDGKDLAANWNWQTGNDLDGNLRTSYSQSLTPFTDFHGQQLNIRVQRHQSFDAGWRVQPSWRLRGAVGHDTLNYNLDSQSALDNNTNTTELGLDYLAKTNSTVGVQVRRIRGDYPNPQSSGALIIDNSYVQDEYLCKIDWQATGKSRLQMLAGWAERKHKMYPERDAKGPSTRIIADWFPTGKTSLNLTAWRDFGAVDGLTA
ncbi:MAG: XrtB/PEP-CTERM-associated polysaccharide biosynthesis outer membrane protein EpsL, partial [Burkholderiaceae bacterium]